GNRDLALTREDRRDRYGHSERGSAVRGFRNVDPLIAAVLGPKHEHVAGAIGLDVAADRRSGRLRTGYLHGGLPRAARSCGSPRNEAGDTLMPRHVNLIVERRARAVVDPHDLPIRARLGSRRRALRAPSRAEIRRAV